MVEYQRYLIEVSEVDLYNFQDIRLAGWQRYSTESYEEALEEVRKLSNLRPFRRGKFKFRITPYTPEQWGDRVEIDPETLKQG